jgi:DNA-binding transcriptional regulator GbsR (MarR family)
MEQLEEDFAKVFGNLARVMGLPDTSVKVLTVLYLEPREIPMDEVAKRTGYSLASVSNALRLTETLGIVERSRIPGSRKVYLYMHKNIGRINLHKMRAIHEIALAPMKTALPSIIARYKHRATNAESREKLKIIESYHDQVIAFEDLVEHWTKDLEQFTAAYEMRGK